ncbi:MAG: hypothetical protein Q8N89_15990 [Azonexus sp.]|nr:hypothetical protein [Azonexus sp.]
MTSRIPFSRCRKAAYFARQWMRGASSFWTLMLIPVALLVSLAVTFVFFEGRKAYWDYRVREMCEKDGGVQINEIVEVNAGAYELLKNHFGQIDIPKAGDSRSIGSIVVYSYKDSFIRDIDPEIRRSELTVVKTSNGAVVATSTTYSRVGGDLLALHPSHFSCPNTPSDFFASLIHLKELKK